MVGDCRGDRRQFDHLADDLADHRRRSEIGAAASAGCRLVADSHIGAATGQVRPGAPGCLPAARFLRTSTPSRDGGADELFEFLLDSASRCATWSRKAVTSARNASFSERKILTAVTASSNCWRSVDPATPAVYQPARAPWWTIARSARTLSSPPA